MAQLFSLQVARDELAEIFMRGSGKLDRIRSLLVDEQTIGWDYMEDLILNKGNGSQEYQELIDKKGHSELDERKMFLQAISLTV